jgi:peptidoglycan hydrolase CwlO-like protein
MKTRIGLSGMLLLLLVSIGLATPALAQNRPMTPQQMQEKCEEMMAKHQQMQQEMAAMDARLEELVQQMNAATGEARVDAMAEVINELFEQRRDMHEMMMEMGPGMMGHMMMHMNPEMMEMCPMMQRHPHGGPPGQMRQDRS